MELDGVGGGPGLFKVRIIRPLIEFWPAVRKGRQLKEDLGGGASGFVPIALSKGAYLIAPAGHYGVGGGIHHSNLTLKPGRQHVLAPKWRTDFRPVFIEGGGCRGGVPRRFSSPLEPFTQALSARPVTRW